ncbi:MAG: hypothetical protein AABY22_31885, partial [Nanoarchaeota archaeon]
EPSIHKIIKFRQINHIPHAYIKDILDIFFPKTRHVDKKKGFFKNVYIIHSKTRKYVLKEGKRKDIRKDHITYLRLCKKGGKRYFAKIYWRSKGGRFILQKYGEDIKVPEKELIRLKSIGKKYGLKDVREANIMKFGNRFKIVDAERV